MDLISNIIHVLFIINNNNNMSDTQGYVQRITDTGYRLLTPNNHV